MSIDVQAAAKKFDPAFKNRINDEKRALVLAKGDVLIDGALNSFVSGEPDALIDAMVDAFDALYFLGLRHAVETLGEGARNGALDDLK